VERPTVPKAEVDSKSKSRKLPLEKESKDNLLFSVICNTRLTKQTKINELTKTTIVLSITYSGTLRLNIEVVTNPFILLFIKARRTTNVVTLIPPAVEPGQAPINIRIITKNNVALVSIPVSVVLKPAVLEVTDRNMALIILFCIGIPDNNFPFSKANTPNVPNKIRKQVPQRAIFVCNDRDFFLFFENIVLVQLYSSSITINPIPPMTISPIITQGNKN